MRPVRLVSIVLLTATLGACAAKAQVRTEVELPLLDPPPPPPRVVTSYQDEPEPLAIAPAAEAVPARPPGRPARADVKPDPPTAPEPAADAARPAAPMSLTLTPSAGSEAQTAAAIRELMARASRDLARVNTAALSADGRAQVEAARRFLQQADDALKARNVVFAGKLADKAATMAAVLVR
ncbi:MAG: hypothetical protein AB7P34_00035 [Vicinamibacterales bacterium]